MDGGGGDGDDGGDWTKVTYKSTPPSSASSSDSGGRGRGRGRRGGGPGPRSGRNGGGWDKRGKNSSGSDHESVGSGTPPATPSRASTPVPSPVPSPSSTFPDFAEEYIRHSFLVRLTQSSDARVAERFMQFLVNYTAPGDQLPFYPTEARALLQRKNSDCHELLVHFDHLREMDKILAFHMCNNQNRLAPILSCVASQFLLNISLQDDVSEETREEKVIKHKPTIESKVILRFIGMPNYRITTLKEFLVKNQDALVEKVRLFSKDNVLVPAKLGSSLFQCCILHLIANHKMGVSWNGEFELTDWEISDDMVSLKKVHHGPLPDDSKVADLEKLVDLLAPFFLKKGSPLFFKQLKDDVTLTSRTLVSASDWEWFWDYLGSHVFYMPPVARLHLIKDLFVAIKTFKLTWVKPFSTVLLDFTEFGDWTIGPMSKTDGQESIITRFFGTRLSRRILIQKTHSTGPITVTC